MPIAAAMIPLIAAGVSAVGKIGQGVIQGMNTRAANRYNSPAAQIQRAKEAHIPLAATQISSGNQSTVTPAPDVTGEASGHIAQYNHNQKTLSDIKSVEEDIKSKNLQNQKLAGELAWYLGKRGADQGTNLSYGLGMEQKYKELNNIGTGFENDIKKYSGIIRGAEAGNIGNKIILENTEQGQRIKNMIQSYTAEGVKIEGYKLDNAQKQIEKEWTPAMNAGKLTSIMRSNDILLTDKALKELQLEIGTATKGNVITRSGIDTALAKLGLEQFGTNYEYNKAYQAIATKARGLVNKPWSWDIGNEIGSWIFTTMSDFSGGGKMPNLPNLGDQSKTFNTYNNIKTE